MELAKAQWQWRGVGGDPVGVGRGETENVEEGEEYVAIVTKKEDISIGFNGREKMGETFETESESLAWPGISIYVEKQTKRRNVFKKRTLGRARAHRSGINRSRGQRNVHRRHTRSPNDNNRSRSVYTVVPLMSGNRIAGKTMLCGL